MGQSPPPASIPLMRTACSYPIVMAVISHLASLVSSFLLVVSRAYLIFSLHFAGNRFPARHSQKDSTAENDEPTPPRISSPFSSIKPSYDVVIIGSGYGRGVAASRMTHTQPRQSVCVLERGSERWLSRWRTGRPASFWTALMELRITGHLDLGRRTSRSVGFGIVDGLYRWVCGKGSSAFMASG